MAGQQVDRAGRLRGSPEPIPGRCGAKLPRTDPARFCQKYPLTGKTRCKKCGGASLSGPESRTWKHGLYSKALPTGLAKHYEAARQNPGLVTHNDQIALVDAKIFELFEQLQTGEAPAMWRQQLTRANECQAALVAYHDAVHLPSTVKTRQTQMLAALQRLEHGVGAAVASARDGATAAQGWDAIADNLYLRKKLVDSETRRRKDLHEMVTRERVLAMFSFVADSIARNVTDPRARVAITNDVRRLLTGGNTEVS